MKVIARIEAKVKNGGAKAIAMPRGRGKTTLCETAVLWAILYGFHGYVAFVGADASKAERSLESIKREFETNDTLQCDFPEACFPIERLERIANRCRGQLCEGAPTFIKWTNDVVVLPTIPRAKSSGAIIQTVGLTAAARGMKHKKPDGSSVRPSLVIIDDPQTDESANSQSQCATRERIIAGAILGLAGPGKKIAALMPCTVIVKGDMADTILDRRKHPEWEGERTKMVYSFPANEKLWDRYRELLIEGQAVDEDGGKKATEFYAANRAAMDEGAVVDWPEAYSPDELSAVQNAMNLLFQNEHAFWAERQNEPKDLQKTDLVELTADQIANKISGITRGTAPIGAAHLTAFIDVQGAALFWLVAGWQKDFTGYVVDYGVWPPQNRAYFTLSQVRKTLLTETKAAGQEAAIHAGLGEVCSLILGREWHSDDGAGMKVTRCLIDANWGLSTDTVYQFCRGSPHAAVVQPSHGKYIGAAGIPMNAYQPREGERAGFNWRVGKNPNRAIRHVLYDTNFWKSFIHERLAVGIGAKGCLSLYGAKPEAHRLLADHLTAEYRVRVKRETQERVVEEWKPRIGRDNHWFDGIVGCAVAASMLGCVLDAHANAGKPRNKVPLEEMYKRARGK